MKIENTVRSVAIGSFDGIHLAHRELINLSDAVVAIERNSGYLTPGYKRTHYTDKPCYFYLFDKIRSLSPAGFVEMLIRDFPHLEKIVVGYDFHFGKSKEGNAKTLRALFGGEVVIVDEVSVSGIPVHSRTIKRYLAEGEIELANRLLGREYIMEGEVIRGQGLGGKELVPTLNLSIDHYRLPKDGVYAGKTLVEDEWMPSIIFLGHRVTTDGSFAVESHILDQEIDVIEGDSAVSFMSFIRENSKFSSLEQLKKQIEKDISTAKKMFASFDTEEKGKY